MSQSSWYMLLVAWVVSVVATLGSLFFSDVMGFIPCSMCWYQRICMYPLVVILLVGLIRREGVSIVYGAFLVVIGWFWSFYHSLLIFGIIEEDMAPCSVGVPCSVQYINWFGFIDIPILSFIAFSIIGVLFILIFKKEKYEK